MKFDKLHKGTKCKCIDGLSEDTKTTFARRSIGTNLHFLSYYEQGKRPQWKDCDHECKFRAVSLDKIPQGNTEHLVEHYQNLLKISPKKVGKSTHFAVVQFHSGAGLLRPTPNNGNPQHCSLFKSDDFVSDLVNVIDIIDFRPKK